MTRTAFLTLAMAMAFPAIAQDLAPEMSPKPRLNQNRVSITDAGNVVVPPEKKADPSSVIELEDDAEKTGMRDQLRETDADYKACLMRLDQMGVVYSEAEPLISEDDADCGILRPLVISEVGPGVAIQPPAMLRCETAQAIATWMEDFVLPASERLSERGAMTSIENGSGYICRRRNNLPDGKLSEHAFGNAFDVMGFRFKDGSRIAIEPREAEGSMAEAFQDAVRGSACLDFSTVLGPGSNASHDDHLHLDVIARPSGYRLCEQSGVSPN